MNVVIIDNVLEPVTLAQAKAHLRIDHNLEDVLIASMVKAARELCERLTGRALLVKTYRQFDPACFPLPLAVNPVNSILSVKTIDEHESEETLDLSAYRLNKNRLKNTLCLTSNLGALPITARDVIVEYTAGYGASAADVPETLKNWILLYTGGLYENRDAVSPVNLLENPLFKVMLEPFNIHAGF